MDIRARICEASIVDCPLHVHDFDEIIVNKSGHGLLTVDGLEYQLDPHTVACVPGGLLHSDSSTDLRISGNISFYKETKSMLNGTRIFYDHGNSFEKLLDLAADAWQSQNPYTLNFLSAIGDAVVALLQSRGFISVSDSGNTDIVDKFDQELRQRFMDPGLNIASEIEKTGYSPNHFRQLYKKSFGCTPREQLLKIRMEFAKAQMRLHSSSLTINQVAAKSGYDDPNHFSKVFHRYESITPSEYLARCRDTANRTLHISR